MPAYFLLLVLLACTFRVSNLAAHEFWIEPVDFTVNNGRKIIAGLKNGENFKGNSLPFLPSQFEQFTVTDTSGSIPVKGRVGDMPAVSIIPRESGFTLLAFESKAKTLRYEKFSKFESFATKEGIEWVLEEHEQQNLPTNHIAEVYFRYAKSLLLVAAGADVEQADEYLGMRLELVLLDNPYQTSNSGELTVRLIFDGEPLSSAQISIFEQNTGLIDRLRTDDLGLINWNFDSGTYLLNAVHAVRPSKELVTQTGAVWQTLWASTTFLVP